MGKIRYLLMLLCVKAGVAVGARQGGSSSQATAAVQVLCATGRYSLVDINYVDPKTGELKNVNRVLVRSALGGVALGVVVGGLSWGPGGLLIGAATGAAGGTLLMLPWALKANEFYNQARPLTADQVLLGVIVSEKFQKLVQASRAYLQGSPANALLKSVSKHRNLALVSEGFPSIPLRETAQDAVELDRLARRCGYQFALDPDAASAELAWAAN